MTEKALTSSFKHTGSTELGRKRTKHRIVHIEDMLDLLYPELECPLSDCRVLDIGCGSGSLALSIAGHVKYVKGIEITDHAIEMAKRVAAEHDIENAEFEVLSLYNLEEQNEYDIILLSDVLEHVKSQWLCLEIAIEALKPGGVLYISTNNKWWPYEGHYFLPFLSYLPRRLANRYVVAFRKGRDYNNYFLLSYFKLDTMLSSLPLDYRFKPPIHAYRWLYRIGKKFVQFSDIFWFFSNAFQVVAKKR
jgi:2-polyprenyl-3-methyl-5-hydroxy-6-metoxy-1,4-benzoquinol methylase